MDCAIRADWRSMLIGVTLIKMKLKSNPAPKFRHGGARLGAGRKPREATRVMRVPERLATMVSQLARTSRGVALPVGAWALDHSRMPMTLPIQASPTQSPVGGPDEDQEVRRLDLMAHLVRHPEAAFCLRAKDDSMAGAGIYEGDLLMADRAVEATPGMVVVAVLAGEFTIRTLEVHEGGLCLVAANPACAPMYSTDGQDLTLWGVVTQVIHPLIPHAYKR
jgi:DNA polymerase V